MMLIADGIVTTFTDKFPVTAKEEGSDEEKTSSDAAAEVK
jgi:hypothetical protein